jgi:hypothetical protein
MSYSEENERGTFVSTAINLQALGAAVGGIIPLIINKNKVGRLLLSYLDQRWETTKYLNFLM